MKIVTNFAFGILFQLFSLFAAEYNYNERDPDGPRNWYRTSPDCGGKRQSPINIITSRAIAGNFPPIEHNFDKSRLMNVKIRNTGHNVQITPNANLENRPFISGGPLVNDSYALEQIHFHWGENDSGGSETRINYQRASMEMHAVFYNTKYGSFKEAADSKDLKALVVIAVFAQASRFYNREFFNFAKDLQKIEQPGSEMMYDFEDLPFSKIVSPLGGYYTYEGSLTTPPCSEIVTWIVLKDAIRISSQYLLNFRSILNDRKKFIYRNYRPSMPLNGRKVYSDFTNTFAEINDEN